MSIDGAAPPRDGATRPDEPLNTGRMALIEHVRELRNRLFVSMLGLLVGVVVAFILWEGIYDFMRAPYCQTEQGRESCELYALGVFDQFKVRLRVAFIGGALLSSPIWLYQLGAFITPALYRKERRYAAAFLAGSLLLFMTGALFAYLTISRGLQFLLEIGGGEIVTLLSIQSYLSFVTLLLLAFGIAFEFPVVIVFLHLVGVLPARRMREWRRSMILIVFLASALITPSQDPFTFLAMALPLCAMYEGCVLFARVHERLMRRRSAADPLAELDPDTPSVLDTRPSRLDL